KSALSKRSLQSALNLVRDQALRAKLGNLIDDAIERYESAFNQQVRPLTDDMRVTDVEVIDDHIRIKVKRSHTEAFGEPSVKQEFLGEPSRAASPTESIQEPVAESTSGTVVQTQTIESTGGSKGAPPADVKGLKEHFLEHYGGPSKSKEAVKEGSKTQRKPPSELEKEKGPSKSTKGVKEGSSKKRQGPTETEKEKGASTSTEGVEQGPTETEKEKEKDSSKRGNEKVKSTEKTGESLSKSMHKRKVEEAQAKEALPISAQIAKEDDPTNPPSPSFGSSTTTEDPFDPVSGLEITSESPLDLLNSIGSHFSVSSQYDSSAQWYKLIVM
ncbi:hypothetical protein HDU67_002325, partial [Dinochytrium kinnereticum]